MGTTDTIFKLVTMVTIATILMGATDTIFTDCHGKDHDNCLVSENVWLG
jgi:hypothetical protein